MTANAAAKLEFGITVWIAAAISTSMRTQREWVKQRNALMFFFPIAVPVQGQVWSNSSMITFSH
jgi:hypothetical protein